MVSTRALLRTIAASTATLAATAVGGPLIGAEVAAFLASPPGRRVIDAGINNAARNQGVDMEDLATGGLVMGPTLGLTGEAGPEFVLPLGSMGANAMMMPVKPKRKPSAYNRRYAREYRRIKKMKTLKSGKMSKGFSGKRGHAKIVKMAHAATKKARRKK